MNAREKRAIELKEMEKYARRVLKYPSMPKNCFDPTDVAKLYLARKAENPKDFKPELQDILAVSYSDGEPNAEESRAIIRLLRKFCRRNCVFAKKGKGEAAFVLGAAATEIIRYAKVEWDGYELTKTGLVKIPWKFPVNRKLKCFGGEKVIDHMDI